MICYEDSELHDGRSMAVRDNLRTQESGFKLLSRRQNGPKNSNESLRQFSDLSHEVPPSRKSRYILSRTKNL